MKNWTFIGLSLLACVMVIFVVVNFFQGALNYTYNFLPAALSSKFSKSSFEGWKVYKSEDGTFEAKFPTSVRHSSGSEPISKGPEKKLINTYLSEEPNGSIFMVSILTFPTETKDSKEYNARLNEAMTRLQKANPQNIVWGINYDQFLDVSDLTFGIENPEQMMINKVFIKGKDLYLLSYTSKKDLFDQANFQYFLDSFKLYLTSEKRSEKQPEKP